MLTRAVRLDQYIKVVGRKIKTMSWKTLNYDVEELHNWVIIIRGFVTSNDPSHITHRHLIHFGYKNIDQCSFNLIC